MKINSTKLDVAMANVKGQTYQNITTTQNALINVKNGFLKIVGDKVELLPHDKQEIRFTQFNAVYVENAEYKPLDDVLEKVFNGNSKQIELFNQVIGYILMNHVRYGKVFFLIGLPRSGKSSILNMIIHFCGEGNTSSITLSTMNETFGLENIIGKTINVDADMGKIKVLSSDLFKKLSTGDEIQVKRKHKSTVDAVNKLVDLEKSTDAKMTELLDLRMEIRETISQIDDAKQILILRYRYIEFMKWEDIAEKMNYYSLKSVYRIHSAALDSVADILTAKRKVLNNV